MKASQINHCAKNRNGAAEMKPEEIVLIRRALTYSVTCLEIRKADLVMSGCDTALTQNNLDTAKKALQAALRLV